MKMKVLILATVIFGAVSFAKAQPTVVPKTPMEELPAPSSFERDFLPPDLLTMFDGTPVTTPEQWEERRQEIKGMLQFYMYGMWRSGEDVSYILAADNKTVEISVTHNGETITYNATYSLPQGSAPVDGWPVIVGVGSVGQSAYALEQGYATISFNPGDISDDGQSSASTAARTGKFYQLYPYDNDDWTTQTGSVMAWAWGASKILDALEAGADAELNINAEVAVVTGVSRWGKAAACAGAFEERFRVSMPVCSGYGGMTMMRYQSDGLTFSLLPEFENDPKKSSANLAEWKSSGGNEPLASIQGGWYNGNFEKFTHYHQLPIDAHFISALSAQEGRSLFMVIGINSDMWSSPPGMWWNYQLAKPAFDLIGLEDNLAIQYHLNLHGIEIEDFIKMFSYINKHVYNKDFDSATFPSPWNEILSDWTLEDLKSCIFASHANSESYEAGKATDPTDVPENPDVKALVNILVGTKSQEVEVSRSVLSEALISPLTGVEEGTGFNFKYGPEAQYSSSYAKFGITLPEGRALSDYKSVTFTCQTDANYYGKKYAVVVAPKAAGLPDDLGYNYGSGAVVGCTNITGNGSFPTNTSTPQNLTLNISAAAEGVTDTELECSIYIHMEHNDGKANYTLSNIKFVLKDDIVETSVGSVNADDFVSYFDGNILRVSSNKSLDKVFVYAVNGALVAYTENSSNRAEIDLSSLPKGIYIVQVKSNKVKIIK